ncbi:hypothetical protein K2X33_09130 [bacterium]|nr:hypothetical protein [bacterium]
MDKDHRSGIRGQRGATFLELVIVSVMSIVAMSYASHSLVQVQRSTASQAEYVDTFSKETVALSTLRKDVRFSTGLTQATGGATLYIAQPYFNSTTGQVQPLQIRWDLVDSTCTVAGQSVACKELRRTDPRTSTIQTYKGILALSWCVEGDTNGTCPAGVTLPATTRTQKRLIALMSVPSPMVMGTALKIPVVMDAENVPQSASAPNKPQLVRF